LHKPRAARLILGRAMPPTARRTEPELTAEQQLEELVARLDPADQKLFRAVRAALRKRFPTAFEAVYAYSHSLVLGVGPTDRGYEATFSIATRADGMRLYFLNGPKLPDPQKVLLGDAKQVRYVKIPSVATLREPAVAQLMREALKLGKAMPKTGRGTLIIKTGAKKQRSARKR
jgi:hypothetical protein